MYSRKIAALGFSILFTLSLLTPVPQAIQLLRHEDYVQQTLRAEHKERLFRMWAAQMFLEELIEDLHLDQAQIC